MSKTPAVPAKKAQGVWGSLAEAPFITTVLVLLVAAIGLNAAVLKLQLHFKKKPVPMRQAFKDVMPPVMGNWVQVGKDVTLDADYLAALGTDQFLFCQYVNATDVGRSAQDVYEEFKDLSFDDQRAKLAKLQQAYPSAVVSLALTYYTGKADTVAHIPERCYVADGFEPISPATLSWNLGSRGVEVRFISFDNQTSRTSQPCHVAYFFQVNGRYESSSLAVRRALQNLFERYGYYAKVELRSDAPDRAAAERSMRELLSAALPEAEKALPDWNQYQGRE